MTEQSEKRRKAENEGMRARGKLFGGIGSILSGIAGVISGLVGAAGLLYAKPDLITVIVPVQILERVVERAQAEAAAAAPAPAPVEVAPQPAPVVVAPPPAAAPAQSLQGDLSATLTSLANTSDTLVANVRLTNNGAAQALIAGRLASIAAGDFSVSNSMGGSCPWTNASRAQLPLGSLKIDRGTISGGHLLYPDNYTPVGPGQSVSVTLLFHKVLCSTPISGTQPMTVSGTFVIVENGQARFASASFENVTPAQAN